MSYLIICLFSISIGSFANSIVSYFLQLSKLEANRSSCFCGEKKLSYSELVPGLSYLFLRGRCKTCKKNIPIRFFITEIIFLFLGLVCFSLYGFTSEFFIHFFIFGNLSIIAIIDFYIYKIPNILLVILLLIGSIKIIFLPSIVYLNLLIAVIVITFLCFINAIFKQKKNIIAIGTGDLKYIALLLLIFNFPASIFAFWVSTVIGLLSVPFLNQFRNEFIIHKKIPFGASLSFSFILFQLLEEEISALLIKLSI